MPVVAMTDRSDLTPEKLAELATKYRLVMLRLNATDADFIACGVNPPTEAEYAQARAEGWRDD